MGKRFESKQHIFVNCVGRETIKTLYLRIFKMVYFHEEGKNDKKVSNFEAGLCV